MRYSLTQLPPATDMTLFLIKGELKSRKFFNTLRKMGLDDCGYQPHLHTLILRSLDINEESDEVFNAYYKIIERRSKKINADNNSIMKQALKVYFELVHERKKLAAKKKVCRE